MRTTTQTAQAQVSPATQHGSEIVRRSDLPRGNRASLVPADRGTTRDPAVFQELLQPSPGRRSAELDARSGRAGRALCGATSGGPVASGGYVTPALAPIRRLVRGGPAD